MVTVLRLNLSEMTAMPAPIPFDAPVTIAVITAILFYSCYGSAGLHTRCRLAALRRKVTPAWNLNLSIGLGPVFFWRCNISSLRVHAGTRIALKPPYPANIVLA